MKAYTLPASMIVLAVALLASVYFYNTQTATGSVVMGQEYTAEAITSADAAATSTLKTRWGALGSIVISATSSGGRIIIYDTAGGESFPTTTTATTTVLLDFDGMAEEGTYTFDVTGKRGLLVEVTTGYDGDAVVTWR